MFEQEKNISKNWFFIIHSYVQRDRKRNGKTIQIRIVFHFSMAGVAPAVHPFFSFQLFPIRYSLGYVIFLKQFLNLFSHPFVLYFRVNDKTYLLLCWKFFGTPLSIFDLKWNRFCCDLITFECTNTCERNTHECFFWFLHCPTIRYQFPWSSFFSYPISM